MSEPFIKISLNRVRQNARRFLDCARSVFDTHQVEIFYAMKANPDHAVLTTIATAGFGIEVIKPAQLTQVRGLGVPVIASGFLKPPALYQANAPAPCQLLGD